MTIVLITLAVLALVGAGALRTWKGPGFLTARPSKRAQRVLDELEICAPA